MTLLVNRFLYFQKETMCLSLNLFLDCSKLLVGLNFIVRILTMLIEYVCAYQGVKNVSFSENFSNILNK